MPERRVDSRTSRAASAGDRFQQQVMVFVRPCDGRVIEIFAAEARIGFDRGRRTVPTVRNHGHSLGIHGIARQYALLRKVRDGNDPLGPRHGVAVAPPAEEPLAGRKVLRQEEVVQIVDHQGARGGHVLGEDRLLREEHHVRLQPRQRRSTSRARYGLVPSSPRRTGPAARSD